MTPMIFRADPPSAAGKPRSGDRCVMGVPAEGTADGTRRGCGELAGTGCAERSTWPEPTAAGGAATRGCEDSGGREFGGREPGGEDVGGVEGIEERPGAGPDARSRASSAISRREPGGEDGTAGEELRWESSPGGDEGTDPRPDAGPDVRSRSLASRAISFSDFRGRSSPAMGIPFLTRAAARRQGLRATRREHALVPPVSRPQAAIRSATGRRGPPTAAR